MAAAAHDTRTGELLNQAYELHEVLESEGPCDIYRATDRKRARAVRVKLLRAEFALQANVVQSFLRAPKTLTGLRHPNVSRVLAVESDETGIPFVVEEPFDGEPLARTIERFPDGMPLGVAMNVLAPVIEALAAAHELGVAHGRLDRDHVLLAEVSGSSVPKLVRLGAARAGAGPSPERTPPELRGNQAAADLRSDVWALGALLYETLCGKAPAAHGKAVPLDERAPHLPGEIVALVERCLSADPKRRPSRASEVRDAVSRVRDRMRPAAAKPKLAAAPAVPRAPVGRPKAVGREVAPQASTQPADSLPPALRGASLAPALADTLPDPDAAASAGEASFAGLFDEHERPTAEAAPPPAAPRAAAAKVSSELAHSATVFAQAAPAAAAHGAMIEFPVAGEHDAAPQADADPELEITAADASAGEDEPEITLEPAAASPAERQPGAELKTLSDLAAAFGPIEGASTIGQAAAPAPEPAATRAHAPGGERKTGPGDKDKQAKPALPSRKQLKQAHAPPARALSEEQLRQLRERTQQAERGLGRRIGALVFLLFALLLAFAIPPLLDPTRLKAQALLGEHAKLAALAFALLSVAALVRTWALQIHARPMLLRPVTIALKVVTAAVCVLAAGFFLPAGALGPIEPMARNALPWAASLFYLFLAMYGIMRGLRETSANALVGIALVMLYSGSFLGAYRVLATSVLVEAEARTARRAALLKKHGKREGEKALRDLVSAGAQPEAGAGAAEQVTERTEVGASEADDMRAIEDMTGARKQKSGELDKLGAQLHELIK